MRVPQFLRLPLSLATVLLAAITASASAAPVHDTDIPPLKHLTSADFTSSIQRGLWFIEGFSPKCHHCRSFAPTWAKVAASKESMSSVGFYMAQVDCLAQGDLCDEKGIKKYPTMQLYRDGVRIEDDWLGTRSFEAITEYLDEQIEDYIQRPITTAPSTDLVKPNYTGEVLALTAETFSSVINPGPIFVKFFAPWCGHCKSLAPIWTKLAARMQGVVEIAEVDCDDHNSLCRSQGVDGYPTLAFYREGQKVDYVGGRNLEALEGWLSKAVSPGLKHINHEELPHIIRDESSLFLYLHNYNTQIHIHDMVDKSTRRLFGNPPVFESQDPQLFTKLFINPETAPVLISIKDHIDIAYDTLPLAKGVTQAALDKWISSNKYPTVQELQKENFYDVMRAPLVVLAAVPLELKADAEAVLREAAKRWKNAEIQTPRPFVFVWMDAGKWSKWLKKMYGLTESEFPAVVIVDHGSLRYYDTDTNRHRIGLEPSSVLSALHGIHAGHIRPKYSETFFERSMRRISDNLQSIFGWANEHIILAGVGLMFGITFIIVALLYFVDSDTAEFSNPHHKDPARLD